MKALLVVDVQNDFLQGGALGIDRADEIIPVIQQLISTFELVVAPQEWHPANHYSFASNQGLKAFEQFERHGKIETAWPDHCIQNSHGADFPAALPATLFHKIFHKGIDPNIDCFSGFFDVQGGATGLHQYLQKHHVDELVICGLATDRCVMFSALDAVKLGYRVTLISQATRGLNQSPGDVDRAIQTMREAGVVIQ